jgi:hypothetical protein
LIRKALLIAAILVLVSTVYGCITINQIAPSSTAPETSTSPTRTVVPTTTPPATTPPATTTPPTIPPLAPFPPFTNLPPLTTLPPMTTVPPLTTLPPFTPVPLPTNISEDCINVNYVTVSTLNSNGKWIVVSGSSYLLNFENNEAGANLAVNIIKFYGMDKMCFVARPNPPMTYFTVNGNAPAGAFPGEDAIGFNPANLTAQLLSGKWIVADGSSSLLNFESNQAGANTAIAIIQKYGFTRMCFVARPNPPMMYFRK